MFERDPEQATVEPTPSRREEARERGQVPRSRDLNVAVSVLGGFVVAGLLGRWLCSRTGMMVEDLLAQVGAEPEMLGSERLHMLASRAGGYLLLGVLPVALAAGGAGLAAAVLQGGVGLRFALVAPDASRLNPLRGLWKFFSLRSLARGAFAAMKILLVGWLLLKAIGSLTESLSEWAEPGLASLAAGDAGKLANASWNQVTSFGRGLGYALVALAVLDYAFQWWFLERRLRMTPAEAREEMNRLEGDPELKRRRRSFLRRALSARGVKGRRTP